MLNKTTINAMYTFKKGMNEFLEDNKKDLFNLELEDFLTLMYCFNSQTYGSYIERYIIEKTGARKHRAKDEAGDFELGGENYEFKVSYITNKKESISLVQVRLWQDIDKYLILAVDTRAEKIKYHIFWLTKEDMEKEMKLLRATPAHGANKKKFNFKKTELRATLKLDSSDFDRWIANYSSNVLR